jgi:uncharacterized membrane protein
MKLTLRWLYVLLAVWWGAFVALHLRSSVPEPLLNSLGFSFLAFVPGGLTLVILGLRHIAAWGKLAISVAISLLELMLVGLGGNTILQLLHVAHPLGTFVVTLEVSGLLLVLMLLAYLRVPHWSFNLGSQWRKLFPRQLDLWLSGIPLLFVLLSVFGANSLNNFGTAAFTEVMIGGVAVYVIVLFVLAKRVTDSTITTAIYLIALALLLMTSLRGWYITGHDIQREFRVFELAHTTGVWQISMFRDPYNACLSITLLPAMFASLLHTLDQYIFKLFFQLFFALCGPITYLVARRWANRRGALLGAVYFMAFPTFFTDMPFLVRQEIAFIFFGLMIYIIFSQYVSLRLRRLLFMMMGVGVVLSHYSTTYTVILLFAAVAVSRPVLIWLLTRLKGRRLFSRTSLEAVSFAKIKQPAKITISMIVLLGALSFLWTSVLTNTGQGLSRVVKETAAAVGNGFKQDNRSTDATNLVSLNKADPQKLLDAYVKNVADPLHAADTQNYYPASTYDAYQTKALHDQQLPLNRAGVALQKAGINVKTLMPELSQLVAKTLEVLAPLGILYILLRRATASKIDSEYYLLSLFSLLFIALNVVLPFLSTEYGILRALQQSMFVLAIFVVIGSVAIGNIWASITCRALKRIARGISSSSLKDIYIVSTIIPVAMSLLFLLFSTSCIPQLFGGNVAVLHLADSGRYYDNYIVHPSDYSGIAWLTNYSKQQPKVLDNLQFETQTDRYVVPAPGPLVSIGTGDNIYPSLVRKSAYVYMGYSNVNNQRATLVYNGDQVSYTYPLQFLDLQKNLLFNNGSARIYK